MTEVAQGGGQKVNDTPILVELPDGEVVLGATEVEPAQTSTAAAAAAVISVADWRNAHESDINGLTMLVCVRKRASVVIMYLDLLYLVALTLPLWTRLDSPELAFALGYTGVAMACDVLSAAMLSRRELLPADQELRRCSALCLVHSMLLFSGLGLREPPLVIMRLLILLWLLRTRAALIELDHVFRELPPFVGCCAWLHYRLVGSNGLYQGPRAPPPATVVDETPIAQLTYVPPPRPPPLQPPQPSPQGSSPHEAAHVDREANDALESVSPSSSNAAIAGGGDGDGHHVVVELQPRGRAEDCVRPSGACDADVSSGVNVELRAESHGEAEQWHDAVGVAETLPPAAVPSHAEALVEASVSNGQPEAPPGERG